MSEGKRKVGRPAQGVTKKVSLTLTAEQWAEIEGSEQPTVAAYIRSMQAEIKRLQLDNESLRKAPTRASYNRQVHVGFA